VDVVKRAQARHLAFAWAALALSAFAWFGSHQFGSNLSFADCRASGALPVLLIGLVALALALGGGLLSWRIWRGGEAGEGHGFIALIGMLTALLLAVAIVLQTSASLIIPRCFG
jgi:hypothetical protein